jgi:hypothetical protein
MPGYCGGISLGNWFDLDTLTSDGVAPETHPLLGFLIAEDIEGLLRFAESLGYHQTAEGYLSKCDLCLDIRKYLVTQGKFPELQPKAFYEQRA